MSGICGDCGATSGCGCALTNGTYTTVSGTGAVGSPYAVNVARQPTTWLTDVAVGAHLDRDALLWDVATSKYKNYQIGSIMALTNTAAIPPGNSTTSYLYSAYSTIAAAVNNTGLTLNYFLIVTGFMAFNCPANQQANVGFQVEINGIAQAEWTGTSIMNQSAGSTQCNGIGIFKAYTGNVAPGASVNFRVRAAWKQMVGGNTTSYQSAILDAALMMA